MVATLVRTTFAQPDAASVWDQHGRVVAQLGERFPAAAELLADVAGDVLAFTGFPKELWKPIWSNNPQERLNKELRRRTDVVGIFPTRCHPPRRFRARRATRRMGCGASLHELREPRQGTTPPPRRRRRGGH
jgi:putative transposase